MQYSFYFRNLGLIILAISIRMVAVAQKISPEPILQTGMPANMNIQFRFSPGGNYLLGSNDIGDHIIWDIRSGKQIKKISRAPAELPDFYYTPSIAISKDEKYLLLPEHPGGGYILYNLISNTIIKQFRPENAHDKFTHAKFSADGTKFILIGQAAGKNHPCNMLIFDINGNYIKRSVLQLPLPTYQNPLLLKLLVGKALQTLEVSAALTDIVFADDMSRMYVSVYSKVYAVNLTNPAPFYNSPEFMPITGLTDDLSGGMLRLYNDQLIIAGHSQFKKNDDVSAEIRDTLFIADTRSLAVTSKVCSKTVGYFLGNRSNTMVTLPITTSENMNVFFDYERTGTNDFLLTARDVLTRKPVFSYKKGRTLPYNTDLAYTQGELNGGYIVAMSANQQYIAECSRDIIIHDVTKRQIKSVISAARGQMKLGAPLFLDSTNVLVPKFYNDGFVFDMRSGIVKRLNKEIDYRDTANNAADVYFSYDFSAQIGIENAALMPDGQSFITTSVLPGLSNRPLQKEIVVWDSKTLTKRNSFIFNDNWFTLNVSPVQVSNKKFIVNEKLIDFTLPGKPLITSLSVKQKRDTFYAVNAMYLPKLKQIVAVCGTRAKPGNPNLIFAFWDTKGNLLKKHVVERPKSKLEYHNYIFDSQISPDSTKLLFCLFDGIAGIFDLKKMSVTSTYEHGEGFENSLMKLYAHHNITASCFIDSEHFLTNGDNNKIYLWTIGKSTPDKIINKEPVFLMSMGLSPDKKMITGTAFDKTVYFINLKTGKTEVRLVVPNKDSYTIFDNNDYYISNKKSNNDISFLYNGQGYAFSQFDALLNRPDKVLSKLGYASADYIRTLEAVWKKRIEVLNYTENQFEKLDTYSAPTIELKGINDLQSEINASIINVEVVLKGKQLVPERIRVVVNGAPLFGVNGKKINQLKKSELVLPLAIPLSAGLNKIDVSVTNTAGAESLVQSFQVTRTKGAIKPSLYIVSIGAGLFADGEHALQYAVKDARDLIALLKQKGNDYDKVLVDTFFNKNVKLSGILNLKNKLLKTRPDDMVIVYYSGHGIIDKNLDYYLSAYQTNFKKPSEQGIPFEKLQWLLDSIPSRNKVMLIDACFGGEIDKGIKTATLKDNSKAAIKDAIEKQEAAFKLMDLFFSDLRKSNGVSEIVAAGPVQAAQEADDLKNGIFTHFLKKGLHSMDADINKDGRVSISELGDYLRTEVGNYTENSQLPTFRHQNIENDITIWKN